MIPWKIGLRVWRHLFRFVLSELEIVEDLLYLLLALVLAISLRFYGDLNGLTPKIAILCPDLHWCWPRSAAVYNQITVKMVFSHSSLIIISLLGFRPLFYQSAGPHRRSDRLDLQPTFRSIPKMVISFIKSDHRLPTEHDWILDFGLHIWRYRLRCFERCKLRCTSIRECSLISCFNLYVNELIFIIIKVHDSLWFLVLLSCAWGFDQRESVLIKSLIKFWLWLLSWYLFDLYAVSSQLVPVGAYTGPGVYSGLRLRHHQLVLDPDHSIDLGILWE